MSSISKISYYFKDTLPNLIELINCGEEISFEFRNKNYHLEYYGIRGWIIVEPITYYNNYTDLDNPLIKYPMSEMAHTTNELLKLPFLEGLTIEEAFNEIKFFEFSNNPRYKYDKGYKTILLLDNIKFVINEISKAVVLPRENYSKHKNIIYVVVDEKTNLLKSIIFFGEDKIRNRIIDLDHIHLGEIPHVHEGPPHNHSLTRISLTKKDKYYITRVKNIWKEHINGLR